MAYFSLPGLFRDEMVKEGYLAALDALRFESTCKRVRAEVQSGWAFGMEEVLHVPRDLCAQPPCIPPWRKALPHVSVTNMRSMSYLTHFTRAQLAEVPGVSKSDIGDAISTWASENPSSLTTSLQAPGQALLVALPTPRETTGKTFAMESSGRVSKSLPIYMQVVDEQEDRRKSKDRIVKVCLFGHTRSLQGKRLCVTCVPASPHLWSKRRQRIGDATKLPFEFVFKCAGGDREHVDLVRLLIVFVSIFSSTGVPEV
eukprot:TRINITY_DN2253_c0_g1_i1.p1 TRINITY_DN2253_c0_g1~~TRINITY_DN2253_c0_g1_i1.p1  ORF type:complete len:257 (+),score=25.23 TRINITY_DN2253_c0_g1_i1:39-809(+)